VGPGFSGSHEDFYHLLNESIIEKTYSPPNKPVVLSLSKHERLGLTPFDKLRVNGVLFCVNKGN